jgi:hypothetical protein
LANQYFLNECHTSVGKFVEATEKFYFNNVVAVTKGYTQIWETICAENLINFIGLNKYSSRETVRLNSVASM